MESGMCPGKFNGVIWGEAVFSATSGGETDFTDEAGLVASRATAGVVLSDGEETGAFAVEGEAGADGASAATGVDS